MLACQGFGASVFQLPLIQAFLAAISQNRDRSRADCARPHEWVTTGNANGALLALVDGK